MFKKRSDAGIDVMGVNVLVFSFHSNRKNETNVFECSLKRRNGFSFNELNIQRIPNDPQNSGNDALVSFYALYPNGTQNDNGVPVPVSALVNAWSEQLSTIQQQTGLQLQVTTAAEESASTESDDLDWPLVLGVSIAGVLLLVLGICVLLL